MRRWVLAAAVSATLMGTRDSAWGVIGSWGVDASGTWGDVGNWVGGVVPGAGAHDEATLGAVISAARTVMLDSSVSLGRLTFSAGYGYTINSAGSGTAYGLTLGGQGGGIGLVESIGAAHTIWTGITLATDVEFRTGSDLSLMRAIGGTGGIIKTGTGTLVLGTGNVPDANLGYAGVIHVQEGVLRAGTIGAFGAGSLVVERGAVADMSALVGRGNTFTGSLTLNGGKALNTGTGALALGGAVTLSDRGVFDGGFGFGKSDGSAGSVGGSGGLWLAQGTSTLRVAAGHQDGTYVQGGSLSVSATGSLVGTGAVVVGARGGLTLLEGAGQSVDANAVRLHGGSLTLNADIDPATVVSAASSGGVLRIGVAVGHDVTVPQGFALGGSLTTKGSVTGSVIMAGGPRVLRLGGGNLELHGGLLAANGVVGVSAEWGPVLLWSGANDYTGVTRVNSGATLSARHAQSLGAGGAGNETEVLAGGTLELGGATISAGETLRLNGGRIFGYGGWSGPVELTGAGGSFENNSPSATLVVGGVISGAGDLRREYPTTGIGQVELTAANTYTGATRLGKDGMGATLRVTGAGSILGTSGVYLNPGATLELNNTVVNLADDGVGSFGRVASTVYGRGGELKFVGHGADAQSVERLPAVLLDWGATRLISAGSATAGVNHQLVVGAIERAPGASLVVPILTGNQNVGTAQNQVRIENATLNDGVLADARGMAYGVVAWNNGVNPEFATHGANGVAMLAPDTADLNASGPTSNVKVTSNGIKVMAGSRTVNSLNLSGYGTLDLGGNQLTIDSGGFINQYQFFGQRNYVQNGSITVGTPGLGGELNVFMGKGIELQITAAIVDNAGGAVGFTKNSEAYLVLSGANTYSGPTTVNEGELRFYAGAFPAGGDLRVNNGQAYFDGSGVLAMGELVVRSTQKHTTASNQVPGMETQHGLKVSPTTVLLEAGWINAELTGTADLTKTSSNTGWLGRSSPGWSGAVEVQEGRLLVGPGTLGTGAVTVGGRGELSFSGTLGNALTLAGGTLVDGSTAIGAVGIWAGPVGVSGDARIVAKKTELAGGLAIGAGGELLVNGGGSLAVSGVQAHGVGARLRVENAGVRMVSDAGVNLDIEVGAGAQVAVGTAGVFHTGGVNVEGGAVVLERGGKEWVATGLTLGGGGTPGGWVDLADGSVRVVGQGAADVARLADAVGSARDGGSWAGAGIGSTYAASDPLKLHGVGWRVEGGDFVAAYVLVGDLNFDGAVSGDDYVLIDRGMAMGLAGWVNGDLDYDGVVGAGDYLLMDRTSVMVGGGALSAGMLAEREGRFGEGYGRALVASVPEPGGLVGGGLGIVIAMGRRKRGGL